MYLTYDTLFKDAPWKNERYFDFYLPLLKALKAMQIRALQEMATNYERRSSKAS